jgi:hypothetical protein
VKFLGERETADEFTTQMTSDNISYEDRGEILERASSSQTDDALAAIWAELSRVNRGT